MPSTPTAQELAFGIESFTHMRKNTRNNQRNFKKEVELKLQRVEDFKATIALDPLLMKHLKDAIKKYPFNIKKIKEMTIDNPLWTEDYELGESREEAGGLKTMLDEQGVPSLEKMKELYSEKIKYAGVLQTELQHARDGEKFWRYSHFFQEEKLGKYHQRMNKYNSDFLQEAMEADADGNDDYCGIIGVSAGECEECAERFVRYETCGETIRVMGISMKEEYDLRENVMAAVRKLNEIGCGKQLIK